jgi:hypothetical protein
MHTELRVEDSVVTSLESSASARSFIILPAGSVLYPFQLLKFPSATPPPENRSRTALLAKADPVKESDTLARSGQGKQREF